MKRSIILVAGALALTGCASAGAKAPVTFNAEAVYSLSRASGNDEATTRLIVGVTAELCGQTPEEAHRTLLGPISDGWDQGAFEGMFAALEAGCPVLASDLATIVANS